MAASVVYSTFGGRVVAEQRGGAIRQYVPDNLGSTIALIDDSGNVTDTYDYWPYGEERVHNGTSTTPLTYLGTLGYFKDFLNMLYVRARHLRVDLTQWMTVDPLWPDQSAYVYAAGCPTGATDPSGRILLLAILAGAGGGSVTGSVAVGGAVVVAAPVVCVLGLGVAGCYYGYQLGCKIADWVYPINAPMESPAPPRPPRKPRPPDVDPYDCIPRCEVYCDYQGGSLFFPCIEGCVWLCDASVGAFPATPGGGSFGPGGPFPYPIGPVWGLEPL